jgi:copper chaperone CopZ
MAERIEWTLQIEGMTCGHCARAVDEALGEVPGVLQSTTKQPEGRSVVVAESQVAAATLVAAVEAAGYKVLDRSSKPAA